MPDVDVLLSQIARVKGFAAAMIDTAMRKRFELMVAEFHRELDARTAGSPCIRLGAGLDHEEPLPQPESDQPQ